MLTRLSLSIPLVFLTIIVPTMGCRTNRPIGKLFDITRLDSDDPAENRGPRQRLATASTRAGSNFGQSNDLSSDRESSENRPEKKLVRTVDSGSRQVATAKSASRNQTISQPERIARDTKSEPRDPDVFDETNFGNAQKKQTKNSGVKELANREKTPPKVNPDEELIKAFENTSPEIKEQALRQLVAVLARTAEKTDKPAPLRESLESSLSLDHKLPPVKNEPSQTPVNRIAKSNDTDDHVQTTEVQTAAHEVVIEYANPKQDTQTDSVAKTERSDAFKPLTQSTTKVQHSEVVPASASNIKGDPSMVASTKLETSIVLPESERTPSVDSITDQQLYATLLKRVSSNVPGESEAEKARRLITARHLMVLAGNPDQAVEKVEGMTEKEQEYLRHQLLGLWTMVDPEGHPVQSRRFSSALPQLREATKYLAAATDTLDVKSLAFCTEILAYGQTKPFSSNRFKAGQQVILYCEIENFIARKTDAGFHTHLQGSYDVIDASNQKVTSQLLPADQQVSANYLRDYFIAYQMHIPQQLTSGKYRLQLTMEDVEGKKYGQSNIAFEIE